jgi:hypothetical protein
MPVKKFLSPNEGVNKELRSWAKANNVDLSKATAEHARTFLGHISNVPELHAFNAKIMEAARTKGLNPRWRGSATAGVAGAVGTHFVLSLDDVARANFVKQCMRVGC